MMAFLLPEEKEKIQKIYKIILVRQEKPGAFSGCNSRPWKEHSQLTRNRVLGA